MLFIETTKSKRSASSEILAPEKRDCKLPEGDIIGLDAAPSASDEYPSIAVTYRNGGVVIVSSDLSNHHETKTDIADSSEVEYSTTLDADTARKGILKNREDLITLLDQNGTPTASSVLLCQVVCASQTTQLQLYILRNKHEAAIQTLKPVLQLIMSYDLPSRRKKHKNQSQYDLHASSGTLYQQLDGKLNIYELSGVNPKLVTGLVTRCAPVTSFFRVSSNAVLVASEETATLYETRYGSVQATASLSSSGTLGMQSKKRKREDNEPPTICFTAISSFTDLGLVVGLSGQDLLALQLSDDIRINKKQKSQGTLLTDVMGKGSMKETYNLDKNEKKAKKWDAWTKKVDELIQKYDIESLERLVANDEALGQQRNREKKHHHHSHQPNGVLDGDVVAYEELWPLPEPLNPQRLDRQKVFYILGQVFGHGEQEGGAFEVQFVSMKLLEWLALTGFLTTAHMRKALQLVAGEVARPDNAVQPGDIMSAIRQIDDDFQLTHDLLCLPVQWEIAEVVQALRLLVQSFDSPPTTEPQLSLAETSSQTNGDTDMVDGDAASDLEFESEAAEQELDKAMNALTNGLEVRSATLRVILARLHAFPHKVVTTTMRAMMEKRELIFFIHLLRIELADGGWTSKYAFEADDGEEGMVNHISGEEESGPNDQAIAVIGDLLNCAVAAIGTSGWLVGLSSDVLGTEELLDSLRAEVSAGLEGCYEASVLGTFLGELERCANSAERSGDKCAWQGVEEVGEEKALLPLGGRLDSPVVKGRNGADGKKSKMAIGREKSRHVGKYSIDRIRI